MEHYISQELVQHFREQLAEEEKGKATIEKYMRDITAFVRWLGADRSVQKERVILYKNYLVENYAVASVNSILAAINSFFKELGWYDCVVKAVKVQRTAFRDQERELTKEEYYRLLKAAKRKGNERLYYLMQTICSTGIRVSELRFITAEAVYAGRAQVSLKGKTRTVLLPSDLCRELKRYIRRRGISSGSVFITATGRPMDRTNILHDMKLLCQEAKVDRKKVFPHNLRHLFACTYYQVKKDITHLADILGHASINTTRIYTLTSGEEQVRQMGRLGLVI